MARLSCSCALCFVLCALFAASTLERLTGCVLLLVDDSEARRGTVGEMRGHRQTERDDAERRCRERKEERGKDATLLLLLLLRLGDCEYAACLCVRAFEACLAGRAKQGWSCI